MGASAILTECIVGSEGKDSHNAGIARWVFAGCDQDWAVEWAGDSFFRPTAMRLETILKILSGQTIT